ncbi:MAG: lysylphosphatidylglycerol synthase transmembrane domain-containing protein, partial [Rhodothermales bacterium]|nr:lysylphosphatidylglycerol synthase transmembrane domain-containing protein [Rhodothermales bacterium]
LLWLALRGVDFGEVWASLRQGAFGWLVPLAVVALASHALRAWRWQMLLEGLPDGAGVPFRPAFYSVMIGYMVNYAAPRLGEVARAANLASRSALSFSGVMGTVVVERVVDVLSLVAGLLLSVGFLTRFAGAMGPLFAPALAFFEEPPVAWWIVVVAGVGVTVGLLVLFRSALRWAAQREGLAGRVADALGAFRDGLLSVLRARRRASILGTTVGIWVCYWLMAYFPLRLLGIADLGLADAWLLLVIGAVGMAVPAPGGVGSYHYVTIQTLTLLFGVAAGPATSYAVLAHAAQLMLYTAVGFACLLLQGSGLRALRRATAEQIEQNPPPPEAVEPAAPPPPTP